MIIASADNLKIKNLKKLKLKKYRQEFGEFFVENLVIILDALKAGVKPISLYITDDFLEKNRVTVEKISQASGLLDYFEINSRLNKSFSNLDTPAGICAVYKTIKAEELKFDQPILYLNSIGDPGNLGTIFRSALAFGFKNIILDETCVDEYNFKTISSAKNAIFKINISHDKNLELLKQIKNKMPIFSTKMKGAKDINILKKQKTFCLVIGDESHGVDMAIEKLADDFVNINISPDIESLNVASATAIILHNIYNK